PAGTYVVNITDNTGCVGSTSVTLVNPPAIVATVTTAPTTCIGSTGSATALVTSGGAAPFTYTWTTAAQTQTINNLAQGSYSVAISDINSCTATATGTVGVQGFTWSASATSTNPKCTGSADGTATVSIINPPAGSSFTYSWSTTPVQTTSVTTASLVAGNYVVAVTDNNGCVSSASVTLTNPAPITATVNTSPTMCSGSTGSATVSVLSGGVNPYTYTWLTSPVQTTAVAVNLAQATYSVIVIDANGCSVMDTGTVQSTGFTWTPVVTASPTKCFASADGTATVAITNSPVGSTYTYTWTPTGQTNVIATNLAVGNYTVTVKDNNGCVSTASTTVTRPTQLVLVTQSTPAICTSNSGATNVTASGGTSPYGYTWATNPVQNTQTASNLLQGQYTVLVTDANNCTATDVVTVKDTADLTVTASQSPDLCSKGVGKAFANPKGGMPYTYVWSTNPVQTTQVADSLQVGSYSVTVTDFYGCISSASTTVINQNDLLSSEFSTSPAGVINAEDPVALSITNYGGWKIDTAYLSNGVPITKNPFPYMFPQYGNYTATYYFTSNNGCKDTVTYDIIVKDYITLYIPDAFTPNGDGRNDYFEAQGTFIKTFEMYIYDRWGVLVKKMDNITNMWDGNKNGGPAPEDTYVYKGTASDIFGKHVTFHGQINLIR
ncbi:MAG TPA: T9SS type B sorting domain-containing protein, partial [Bacteroidia bacterium]|nr:T9SS type B sorting domain-containing protein [Bacteroidia bacterium]